MDKDKNLAVRYDEMVEAIKIFGVLALCLISVTNYVMICPDFVASLSQI